MKPTNSQTQAEIQDKIEDIYEEIMNCSKYSKKNHGNNFKRIKTKFWILVNRLEKLLASIGQTLDSDKRIKLNVSKRKFK